MFLFSKSNINSFNSSFDIFPDISFIVSIVIIFSEYAIAFSSSPIASRNPPFEHFAISSIALLSIFIFSLFEISFILFRRC